MALEKIRLGTNDDGTPHFLYRGEHVVLTGNATGTVTLNDGTVVDVTDSHIEAASPEQAQEIVAILDAQYNETPQEG